MKTYLADNVSGWEGCIFLGSIINKVLDNCYDYDIAKFRFYGDNFEGDLTKEFIDLSLYRQETGKVIKYALKNPNVPYFWKRARLISSQAKSFEKKVKLIQKNIKTYNNKQLKDAYKEICAEYAQIYGLGGITFIYESFIGEILTESLAKHYDNSAEIIHHFTKTAFRSFMLESEELLQKIKKESNQNKKEKLKKQFLDKFFFMKTNYHSSKILDEKDIEEFLAIKHEKNKQKELKLSHIELNKKEKAILNLMEPTIIIRDVRKKVNLIGSFIMYRFLEEVSGRTKIPENVLRNAFWYELPDILGSPQSANKLKKRKKASIVFIEGKAIYSDKILLKERPHNVIELKGTPASVGKAVGKVKIMHGPRDFSRFSEGEILVTFATRPDFIPVMKKSAAILTQEGGITSHAAIVSRELGKPCIVGIKGLLNSLKNGDEVEIDASKGLIKILKEA